MALNNYGLFDSNYAAKKAAASVSRWNDGVKRHTLYTVCGTTQDGWGIINVPYEAEAKAALYKLYYSIGGTEPPPVDGERGPNINLINNDAVVGLYANPALFNWVPVSYPASWPLGAGSLDNDWQPQNISFRDSVALGVKELTSLILATPGTFGLVGMSQGSMVITKVLHAMMTPGTAMSARMGDCIGGLAYGNPFRKPGSSFTGGTYNKLKVGGVEYVGGGLFSSAPPNTTPAALAQNMLLGNANIVTPDWWWEMSTPNDFFSDSPITTVAATAMGEIARAAVSVKGSIDALELAGNLARSFIGPSGITLQGITSLIQALTQPQIRKIIVDWLGAFFAPTPNPHILYGVLSPPTIPTGLGLSPKATFNEVGVAYMNARGRAIAPR
jgi:hypothetical protein